MVRAIISWSLHNRLIVILGVLALIGAGDPLGAQPERRGVSRPDAPAGRGHHPEPRGQPRGDGAAGRHPAGDGPQRDAGPRGPAEHLDRRPERHQVPVRLRHRLLGGPPGGHQPDRLRRPPRRGSSPGSRPGARPARSSATSWKGPGYTTNQLKAVQDWVLNRALKTGPRRDRRDGLRRDGQAVSGPARPPPAQAIRRDDAAGRGRDRPLQRQRRRRHPDAGEPVPQRPGHRAAGGGDRPARPGQRRAGRRDRGREARGHPRRRRRPRPTGTPIYVRQVAQVDRRAPAAAGDRRPGRTRTTSSRGSS